MDSVIYGRPFCVSLKAQVEASGANSVFLLASGTLDRETDLVGQVRRALGNGVTDPVELDNYRAQVSADGKIVRQEAKPPAIRTIAIPTTLSAGEYTASAGCTDTVRQVKESIDDAEDRGARPRARASTPRNGCSCRPGSAPSTTRSRTSARQSASRSRKAPPTLP